MEEIYDPLHYGNLTRNLVRELMSREPVSLPIKHSFSGPGVYALFYTGNSPYYQRVRSVECTRPIYVGKAVPPGARKGGMRASGASLFSRLKEHAESIQSVESLDLSDFRCRYLVVVPLWITMSERFLIEFYKPVWNICIEGFGNHDPGKGRHEGMVSWWDCLHPGRFWVKNLRKGRTLADAHARLESYYAQQGPEEPKL